MRIVVSSEVTVYDPTPAAYEFCVNNLVVANPEYARRIRMGKWLGDTPKYLNLYRQRGEDLIIPFGAYYALRKFLWQEDFLFDNTEIYDDLAGNAPVDYGVTVPLYDYQKIAVEAMRYKGYGILQSPAGSGKTQMGIAMIIESKRKALWLTHTKDLLQQSYDRAAQYVDEKFLGKIAGGKVHIGEGITFATVQTMANLDLSRYKYEWDMIVVDECFPKGTMVTMKNGEKPIETLHPGDYVLTYNHEKEACEYKQVENLQIRPCKTLVKVRMENGIEIVCTENHPFYVRAGVYKKAVDLTNDDEVCYMRCGIRHIDLESNPAIPVKEGRSISLLFKRMLQKRDGSSFNLVGRTERTKQTAYDKDEQRKCFGANEKRQSIQAAGGESKNISNIKRDGTQTTDSQREWLGSDSTARNFDERIGTFESNCRVCSSNRRIAPKRLSDLLQNRYCYSGENACYRGRWSFPLRLKSSSCGCNERGTFAWKRVDSVEVQKQSGDGTFGGLCPDGHVYNLSVKGNHNYFANQVLVHNCHRCAGAPASYSQFAKVLNSLAASEKYGLSATVHRADGMIKATFALLGGIGHTVPDEATAGKVEQVRILKRDTGTPIHSSCQDTDGTLLYGNLLSYLTGNSDRNRQIASDLIQNAEHYNLILSDRLDHLKQILALLPPDLRAQAVMIIGSSKPKEREQAMEDMRSGRKRYLFASYRLAKEGLDIPRLDRLYLTTPQKDYAIIVQAVGRIARHFDGKVEPVVYDYVDNIRFCENQWKKRCTSYRKIHCIM